MVRARVLVHFLILIAWFTISLHVFPSKNEQSLNNPDYLIWWRPEVEGWGFKENERHATAHPAKCSGVSFDTFWDEQVIPAQWRGVDSTLSAPSNCIVHVLFSSFFLSPISFWRQPSCDRQRWEPVRWLKTNTQTSAKEQIVHFECPFRRSEMQKNVFSLRFYQEKNVDTQLKFKTWISIVLYRDENDYWENRRETLIVGVVYPQSLRQWGGG